MRPLKLICLLFILCLGFTALHAQDFIHVENGRFIKNGEEYNYLGTNFWYGMNLGYSDPDRLKTELDSLQRMGVNNLRIMAASEGDIDAPWRMQPTTQPAPGEYNEDLLKGLDLLLDEMGKRDMVAVVCMNNFWPWSGGMSQYLSWANHNESIPYPPPAAGGDWGVYQRYAAQFYSNKKAVKLYEQYLEHIVKRTNTVNGKAYTNDPTIMAWQLANEPEGADNAKAYRKWVDKTAKMIKSCDNHHMVSIGSEGNTPSPKAGTNFKLDHQSEYIDYCTMHIWVQNWGWYDPKHPEQSLPEAKEKALAYLKEHLKVANELKKPMVLEEFGISRDFNSHTPMTSTEYRDQYYDFMFSTVAAMAEEGNHISGVNFWAWGGLGRPRAPHVIWKKGDDFIGDPPHEYQGWYSVYNTDASTIEVIKKWAETLTKLQ
ncbi:glycoside hydrolase 5 family protein [Fulvivirga ligni]|uniref:glycoside hydrolase 5 family protein n=1 Tax=Fulvivirga ligni TaxID=2904246 RepID=UPI001F35754F|nr:glycoside hydrolase family 2 TIM barrel-domain containing protein [Fulvivirga ligni]UII20693.1 cellulase family glycosylhydrolase [Fulvivirga ligni]